MNAVNQPVEPLSRLSSIAASMARGEGVCEKAHRNGEANPHIHYGTDVYMARCRELADIARAARVAAPSDGPDMRMHDLFATALQEGRSVTVFPGDEAAAIAAARSIGLTSFTVTARGVAAPSDGLREACDHCWDGWSSDADGNDTELACKHCGAVEETDFGRAIRELAECRAALATTGQREGER